MLFATRPVLSPFLLQATKSPRKYASGKGPSLRKRTNRTVLNSRMMPEKPDVFRYFSEPADVESKCIFCKIGDGRIKPGKRSEPEELLYQDEEFVAFNDIAPGAKYHFLVIPKKHLKNCWALNRDQLDRMEEISNLLISKHQTGDEEVRTFFIRPPWNSVYHVHMHVMMGDLTDWKFNPRRLGYESPWFHITPSQLRNYWDEL